MRTERRFNAFLNRKRSDSSDQSGFDIEFECQSGNYSDCIENMTDEEESIAEECKGILMFSKTSSSCGAYCNNESSSRTRSTQIKRQGWTLFTR